MKNILIIGGSSGVGESITKRLSKKYNITIVDHSFELYGKCSGNVHCACNLD